MIIRIVRWTDQLDVVDFAAVGARDSLPFQGLPDAASEVGQPFDVAQVEPLAGAVHEEEPVAAPGHISGHRTVAFDIDLSIGPVSIARHVLDGNSVLAVIFEADDADGRFEPVLASPDAAQMAQCNGDANGAVAAHVQHTDVVEENDAGHAARLGWLGEQGADEHVGAARLVHDRVAEGIALIAEAQTALGQAADAQIRPARNHRARRLAAGMRIDDLNVHAC